MYLFDSQSFRIGDNNFFQSSAIPDISGLRNSIGLGNIIALYSSAHESKIVFDGARVSRGDSKALIEQQPVETSGDTEFIQEVV